MAKLYIPFDVGHVTLLPSLQEIYEIVMRNIARSLGDKLKTTDLAVSQLLLSPKL